MGVGVLLGGQGRSVRGPISVPIVTPVAAVVLPGTSLAGGAVFGSRVTAVRIAPGAGMPAVHGGRVPGADGAIARISAVLRVARSGPTGLPVKGQAAHIVRKDEFARIG